MQITTIGLDIAKNVFHVHGIDAAEKVVVRKQLRRGQVIAFFKSLAPCLIGMEACATAHYWARELTKLGHQVRLMPAKDVKAYVKRNKNDAADAEAICEAVRRPTMRFVPVKSAEQQARLMRRRVRDLLMRQRTQLINALRAHLAELGIAAAQGREGIKELLAIVAQHEDTRLPVDAHASLIVFTAQLQAVQTTIGSIEKRIVLQHRSSEESKRLETIPGIGIMGATTIAAVVPDPKVFRSAVTSRRGSGSCRGRIRPAASRSSGQFRNRAIATCAHPVRWSLRRLAACAPAAGEVSLADTAPRPAAVQGRRGRACQQMARSPGRCWPRVGHSGRLNSRQRRTARHGIMGLRPCVQELQG